MRVLLLLFRLGKTQNPNHLQTADRYQEAIERAVRAAPNPPHVLDIGTGTGLLAMMAAREGACRVTACEAYAPMASVAVQVIASNAAQCNTAAIDVIAKRSTELPASLHKADLIVTEIFDTDLLGEGVLGSLADAMTRLAKPTATVVPAGATVYVQPVQSTLLASWDAVDLDAALRAAAACC